MSASNQSRRNPFGVLDNKSAEQLVTENKGGDFLDALVDAEDDETEDDTDGPSDVPAGETDTDPSVAPSAPSEPVDGLTQVVMLHHDSHDGLPLVPGVEYGLPAALAADLIRALRAVAAS